MEECKSKHIFESPKYGGFITFLRDSTLVVCDKRTGLVRLLYTGTGEVKNEMQLKFAEFTELECSSDGRLVAAALGDGSIKLWDTEIGEIKSIFPSTWKATPRSIKLSSDGEVMAVVHSAGCTILWTRGRKVQERMFSGAPSSAQPVVFSPNNQVMALAGRKGIFLIGDEAWFGNEHGQASKRISEFPDFLPSGIVFSRDSKLAAFVMPDSEVRLCDTGQEKEMRVLKGHSDHVSSVAFSPISPLLASASHDHTVILWDTEKGEKLCTLRAHSYRVTKVGFSPNGELVATASSDGRVGLWNVSQWMK